MHKNAPSMAKQEFGKPEAQPVTMIPGLVSLYRKDEDKPWVTP